jgi:repressor LexA
VSVRKPERRAEVLAFVRAFHDERGYGPTYREIATEIGLAVSTVQSHVRQLLEAGELTSEPHLPRTLRPTEE